MIRRKQTTTTRPNSEKRTEPSSNEEEKKHEDAQFNSGRTGVANSSGGWFATGKAGEERTERKEAEMEREFNKPFRITLKPKTERLVTFLDDKGFYFSEHALYMNGKWVFKDKTCLSDFDNCPLCDANYRPAQVCAFTVIDHSEYIIQKGQNKGKKLKNMKRLLILKKRALVKLLDKRNTNGGLVGTLVRLKRFTSDEASTGEDFTILKKIPKEALVKMCPQDTDLNEWLRPYDYMEIFKPESPEKLRRCIPGGGVAPVGGASDIQGFDNAVDADLEQYL